MEEVDTIILHFLKQLDVNFENDIKNLSDLPVETIIEAASKCLRKINTSLKLPPTLPSGISHRIEVAALIAAACKDVGYKNDVGYQTFLYYNESELRQVFMFLIEHLPNEHKLSTNISEESPGIKTTALMKNISQKLSEELNRLWIPTCCDPVNRQSFGDNHFDTVNLQHTKQHISNINLVDLTNSLSKINKSSNNSMLKQNEVHNIENENIAKSDGKCLKELKELAIVSRQKLNELESERNVMEVEFQQAKKSCDKAESDFKNVQAILQSIGISNFSDLDDVDNILEKVQNNIERLHIKSEDLTSRNLQLRMEIVKLRNKNSLSESERTRCRNALLLLKENAKSMKEEYNKKEILKDQLKMKYEKLKSGNKRSLYTKRILEIISNVDKQNIEINKILMDTRQLQKEINTLEGQLDRCFSIADETFFGDAKKDDQAKKAYKLLALLHSECNTIVSLVNDTGSVAREIVDLEDNIKSEKSKRTEDTLKKIQLDITRMQEESNNE